MPTTTEARRVSFFPWMGLVVVLGVWFGGMAVAAALFDPSAVIVFAPSRIAVAAIGASDGRLLTVGAGFATATSETSGFVRRLYAQGAWFVWPSLTQGCFSPGRFRR